MSANEPKINVGSGLTGGYQTFNSFNFSTPSVPPLAPGYVSGIFQRTDDIWRYNPNFPFPCPPPVLQRPTSMAGTSHSFGPAGWSAGQSLFNPTSAQPSVGMNNSFFGNTWTTGNGHMNLSYQEFMSIYDSGVVLCSPDPKMPAIQPFLDVYGQIKSNITLNDVIRFGMIINFAKTAPGFKFLFNQLRFGPPSFEKKRVIDVLFDHFDELIVHETAHSLLMQLIDVGPSSMYYINQLMDKIQGHVWPLAQNNSACRVLQKMIENGKSYPKWAMSFLSELRDHAYEAIVDQNANRLILKILDCVDPHNFDFLMKEILNENEMRKIAHDKYGCRILQHLLNNCNQKQRILVIGQLFGHNDSERNKQVIREMSKDQYANYVVQHILRLPERGYSKPIYNAIRGHIVDLSVNQFSSYVIEECISLGNDMERDDIIEEAFFWAQDSNGRCSVRHMLLNRYGNYVVQKMLLMCGRQNQKGELVREIMKCKPELVRLSLGKKVLEKVSAILPSLKQTPMMPFPDPPSAYVASTSRALTTVNLPSYGNESTDWLSTLSYSTNFPKLCRK